MELKRQPVVLKEMRKSCLRDKPNGFKMGIRGKKQKKRHTSEETQLQEKRRRRKTLHTTQPCRENDIECIRRDVNYCHVTLQDKLLNNTVDSNERFIAM